ncbi:uncharacterized protein SCHCODRAFT_02752214 [Schizophyllum commune H4-8]|nr:uncharacterized protein SCHCODRAFT_02752214 [Schizophyllum commune H4-8]KAI5887866.1 hypothetical protein SCHCODRAFT_02752214 [Schizophyllum commune H4-8]
MTECSSAGELLLQEAARVDLKRPAPDNFFLPPPGISSLDTALHKRRRIDARPHRRATDSSISPHFHAYEHGILHRDISDETALVHKSDAMAVGRLVDWYISCPFDSTNDVEASAPNRRGTTPFVAIGLQSATVDGKPLPLHSRYCHDLESLFWLLLWSVVHFDIPNARRLPCRIPKWRHGAWEDVAIFKHCILTSPNTRQGVLDLALPIYEDLVERWVVPLAAMFRKARDDAEDIDQRRKCFFNAELYAKEATFTRFLETIQSKPLTWSRR